jgi:hypothetical protein
MAVETNARHIRILDAACFQNLKQKGRATRMNANQTMMQIMEFNKNTFDNTYNAMMNIGEQNEKMLRSFMERSWISEERRKVILEWVDIYRKGWVDLKKAADENYKTAVKYMDTEKKGAKAK